ncbi:S-methyl-5'-thioadenosine phosphorylase [Streptomyces zingiberis]|uniref:Purine nucleoside phosphorylase n=1 Tax=Streptomyces zingiberis TaxID=2053010 RepID=A0ABX1BQ15_9ACTN|nr:S-methyl-5'-thioadenosine phosphorylase [Streptomyces zingiberis]NJP99818.1 S-methyl-5'-thioadenosine phosphorylase [Streptomyces zingiberis]
MAESSSISSNGTGSPADTAEVADAAHAAGTGTLADPLADIGVIGGSGFYSFLDDVTEVTVETPYGSPSDSLFVGEIAGRKVAFLPRHGRGHHLPPARINYRANLWALRSVGVRQVLAPCAVGGLREEYGPGTLLVPDQLVDRTKSRVQTYYDGEALADGSVPQVVHMSFADPYCPAGRRTAVTAARGQNWEPVDGGTLVVIEGPRFSTRAESRWHAAQGWSIVGMTGHPEAVLARELALCYTSIALVTDLDAGAETGEGVSHEEVLRVFAENIGRLRPVLFDAVAALPETGKRDCLCASALDGMDTGITLP